MTTAGEVQTSEHNVREHSGSFHKELGLRDLVLTQVLFIVGLGWVGTAARLGPSHVVFWILAILLFYLPSAAVVMHLNRMMPLEGGLYQWAKLGFNEMTGFLVAWNLWLYVIVNTSELGLQVTTYLSYALGSEARWMASHKPLIMVAGCVLLGGLVAVSALGLRVGKWLHNVGGILILVLFAAMVVLPFLNFVHGTLPNPVPFSLSMPALTLLNLNLLGKMGFGALGGFEYVAIVAGECRDPVRTIGKSVLIAAPVIAAMFILGTGSMLAFLPPAQVDLIGPIAQVLDTGSRSLGLVGHVVPIVIMTITVVRVAQASVSFTGSTRLPMVAGWDYLLPQWFTRLHPRYHTPVNSILFVGAVTMALAIAVNVGVGEQEAFQLLNNASGTFYALTYLVMFALPIIGLRNAPLPTPLWLRAAAVSGFLMTALYVGLSIFPIVQVGSVALFAAK
ncbi:MAG TPA: APC family permease, partial [Vicinamibacterales bacterium]|nr:APC family permease [Vicinamibacterales bacterium]